MNINMRQLNYASSSLVNKDSLLPAKTTKPFFVKSPSINTETTQVDPVQKIKQFIPKSVISVGYDYGFLPYTVNMSAPASAVKTEGKIATDVCNIPLDVTFFYSSQKNLIGLNNYFRISFNAERYRDQLNSKLGNDMDSYKGKLGAFNSQKQELVKKMAYADYLSSIKPELWPLDSSNSIPQTSLTGANTSGFISGIERLDTAAIRNSIGDTLETKTSSSKEDSLQRLAINNKHKKDSLTKIYDDYKNKYDLVNDSIKEIQNKIHELETLTSHSSSFSGKSPYLTNVQNFLGGVKKFEIGLCYPAYSTFLTNNIPIRGVNFEYQKNKMFMAFTYGTTVNTLLYNPRNVDGLLQRINNSYDYFNISNLSAGRKILAIKFGYGEKDQDHIFGGFLLGKGAGNYFTENYQKTTSQRIESNLVLEADLRKKISKKTILDIIVGKSSLQQEDLDVQTIKLAVNQVFSNFRSYASLVRLRTTINATKSNLTFSLRVIDPFFNSYGIGFIRSDNLRYEVKLDQPITNSVRYVGVFRREEDNLLRLLNYKNIFYSLNNSVSFKIKRGLTVRAGYTPLVRNFISENYHMKSKSAIITGMISFNPKSRNVQKQFDFLYNNYHVITDSMPLNFQNFSYRQLFTYENGFKTGLNIFWCKSNLKEKAGNNFYLFIVDVGYQFKNGSLISVSGKSAYKLDGQFYPGFTVKSAVKISKILVWENQIEKFIVGELFNGYDLENLKSFPYCFTTKLIINF